MESAWKRLEASGSVWSVWKLKLAICFRFNLLVVLGVLLSLILFFSAPRRPFHSFALICYLVHSNFLFNLNIFFYMKIRIVSGWLSSDNKANRIFECIFLTIWMLWNPKFGWFEWIFFESLWVYSIDCISCVPLRLSFYLLDASPQWHPFRAFGCSAAPFIRPGCLLSFSSVRTYFSPLFGW